MTSFRNAARGVRHAVRTQRNLRIQLFAALVAVGLGLWLEISAVEWAVLALTVCLVLAAEMANTAVEVLADAISPDYHPLVGTAKDVAAGAVLITAAGALAVGVLLLGRPLLKLAGW